MKNETIKTLYFFKFEDLRIYQKSLNYILFVDEITQLFPIESKDIITKFNSSARDISLNIAEGSSLKRSQFIFYLKMAQSAIRNCLIYTTISLRMNYITSDKNNESRNELKEMTKMIGALIKSLKDNNGNNNNKN
ncbi:MAG: four helix bundle protein [Bacteroidales bacterium]|nr:four helix bundle protein [Bacteroidales bacterium]